MKNLRGAAALYAATMGISLFFWKVKPWWAASSTLRGRLQDMPITNDLPSLDSLLMLLGSSLLGIFSFLFPFRSCFPAVPLWPHSLHVVAARF